MKDLAIKYRNKELYDLSCSETIIYAANEKYNLGLNETHFHMMAPFSGGMYERDVCGIVSASIAVLGILLTKDNSHNSPVLKEAVLEYKKLFQERFETVNCDALKSLEDREELGCNSLIIESAELLEEIVTKYVKV